MTSVSMATSEASPLKSLRRTRLAQALTLMTVADTSVVAGILMMVLHRAGGVGGFVSAVGFEFVIWGGIDLVFAAIGITQSAKVARTPMSLQTEIDEFASGEKLLRALRFNHSLNVGYLMIAAALFAWAAVAKSPVLAGHGVGVLVQGGFLFVFDSFYEGRLARVLGLHPTASA